MHTGTKVYKCGRAVSKEKHVEKGKSWWHVCISARVDKEKIDITNDKFDPRPSIAYLRCKC